MKKNSDIENQVKLIRLTILSLENIDPNFAEKLQKVLNELPTLNLLYHKIKLEVDLEYTSKFATNKLLFLLREFYLRHKVQNFTENDKKSYNYKQSKIFSTSPTPLLFKYNQYKYEQYYARMDYYEKKLNLIQDSKKRKTPLKGLVLIKFLLN